MKWVGDEDAKMIDVNLETETATILANGQVYRDITISDIGTDVKAEFARLEMIRTCLANIVVRIKRTDGEEGTLLAEIRDTILNRETTTQGPDDICAQPEGN